jgi:glucose-6-phosphate 1-epimerase
MEIELWNGEAKAIVDPMGAWLTNLSDDNGDILYPKRSFKTGDSAAKDRGGLFVCAPNFGPGGNSGLAQHGFGRSKEWEVVDKTGSSVLLKLMPTEGEYKDVSFVVSYQLNDRVLITSLDIANDNDSVVRVAPAFHPYFATHDGMVKINGEKQSLGDLHEAIFEQGETQEIELVNRMITCDAPRLTTWARWTDELGAYVCLEPSLAGFSFLNDIPAPEEMINSGETKTYSFTLTW